MSEKNEIFAENLKALRIKKGWTQEKAAQLLGIKRTQYGAWEEGRGFPDTGMSPVVARVFKIYDWLVFISNEIVAPLEIAEAPKERNFLTDVQKAYDRAPIKEKLAVNILLGLVELD